MSEAPNPPRLPANLEAAIGRYGMKCFDECGDGTRECQEATKLALSDLRSAIRSYAASEAAKLLGELRNWVRGLGVDYWTPWVIEEIGRLLARPQEGEA